MQATVFLQLVDLFGERFSHRVEADGKARHLVFAIDNHPFPQVAGGKPLGDAAGRTHGHGHLLREEPHDTHEQNNEHHATKCGNTPHERQCGFLRRQRHDEVKLHPSDIRIGGGADDQGLV